MVKKQLFIVKERRFMLWKAIQLAIVLAIVESNVVWHWTPNSYVVILIGIGAAWLVTHAYVELTRDKSYEREITAAQRRPLNVAQRQATWHPGQSA